MHYLKYNHEEKNRLSQWSPGHQLGRAPRCTAQDGPWVIWMLWFCVFFSEDPMSIRCFTVITRVLLNKPHISESLFFCPRSWNGFIKPKIGIPLVQIQPIRDPFVTHAHCEEIPGAAGPDALHFADRVADQLLVPWQNAGKGTMPDWRLPL